MSPAYDRSSLTPSWRPEAPLTLRISITPSLVAQHSRNIAQGQP